MQPIPLIRAATVADVAEAMDAGGASTNRMLETSGISPRVRENRLGFVPGRCVWAFIDEYSRRSGRREFLFEMARQSNWRRARWATGMTHCVTLGDALRRMGSGWAREIPMNRMGLTVNESGAWFWRRRTTEVRGWVGNEPAEQYCLSYMLEVIRAAAGPQWQPTDLMLESCPSGWGAVSPALDGVRKQYREPQLAVAFPRRLLALPVSIQPLLDNPRPPNVLRETSTAVFARCCGRRWPAACPARTTSPRDWARAAAACGGGLRRKATHGVRSLAT